MGVQHRGRVLLIDDDDDTGHIVNAVLTDAGFTVSILASVESDAMRAAVGQFEPDCVLLDGQSALGYGESWTDAAWMAGRSRPVPVIMFTVDVRATREARAGTSDRSQLARFHAVLPKPFDLDDLVDVVAGAVGRAVPFDFSPAGEAERAEHLKTKLERAGAQEIHVSTRRQWANFRTAEGTHLQLYWSPRDGAYYLTRHAESAGRLEQVGLFHDLDTAIAVAMTTRSAGQS